MQHFIACRNWFAGRAVLFAASLALAGYMTALGPSFGKDLTPEVRAMLFTTPGSVTLKQKVVKITLEGTDYHGFYRCPYMRVYVNGKGPFTFLFDTGGSYTVVSKKVMLAAHVPVVFDRNGERDIGRIKRVKVGDLEINDLWAVSDDNYHVDGVFGFRAFGKNHLLFKLGSRQLLVSAERIPLPNSFEVPYVLNHTLPAIALTTGNVTISTLIDTGDDAFGLEVRSEDIPGVAYTHPPVPADTVLNGANEQATRVTTLAQPLHFGPLTIEGAVIGLNDDLPLSDVGDDFLQKFNFEFDMEKMTVTFQPLFTGTVMTIEGNLGPGFMPKFDGTGTATNIIPGMAAAQSGMQPGDKIISINGLEVSQYNPKIWDQLLSARKPISVRWMRGTSERLDSFEIRELR